MRYPMSGIDIRAMFLVLEHEPARQATFRRAHPIIQGLFHRAAFRLASLHQ